MQAIHISTAQQMMLRPDPVDLVVFKSDGSLVSYPNVISLKYDFYKGTRTIKFLRSNEIRTVRDVCISRICIFQKKVVPLQCFLINESYYSVCKHDFGSNPHI